MSAPAESHEDFIRRHYGAPLAFLAEICCQPAPQVAKQLDIDHQAAFALQVKLLRVTAPYLFRRVPLRQRIWRRLRRLGRP